MVRRLLLVMLVLASAAVGGAAPLGQIKSAYSPTGETALVAGGQPGG
jgi:hypothetical protein